MAGLLPGLGDLPRGGSIEDRAEASPGEGGEGRPAPAWKREIEELHAFFQDWIGGAADRSADRFGRLEDALAEGFTFVTPSGESLEREAVIGAVRRAHGTRPGLRITIREPRLVHSEGDHRVATYQEWQETEEDRTGRISTVVFRRREGAPHGLVWIHLHETWIGSG